MKINVKRISNNGETLAGVSEPININLDEDKIHIDNEITYNLHTQLRGNSLLIRGLVQARATLQCGRCLKKFHKTLRVEDFVSHHELKGEDFVDLTPEIREDIILQLPHRALCFPECKGLCPKCGMDLNDQLCQCETSEKKEHWHMLDQLKLK